MHRALALLQLDTGPGWRSVLCLRESYLGDPMTQEILQGTATLLALVNPAMCAVLFSRGVALDSDAKRIRQALAAALAITLILAVAAFAGVRILEVFGVTLSAFSVAGGGVLVAIGIKMMLDAQGTQQSETESKEPSITPLILFAASPGTITGVITIGVAYDDGLVPSVSLIAIAAVMAILLATLLVVARTSSAGRKEGMMRQIITSYMGLIVIAMGVQFGLSGWKEFMIN